MFVPVSANTGFPGLSAATAQALQAGKGAVSFNLDEIFGDCFFTPDGETVFLSAEEQYQQLVPSNECQPTPIASRLDPSTGAYVPVHIAGGIATTHLDQPGAQASVMGPAEQQQVVLQPKTPIAAAPSHHMGFVTTAGRFLDSTGKKRRHRPGERKMSDQQKVERRYVSVD